jgi:hypothetical protein
LPETPEEALGLCSKCGRESRSTGGENFENPYRELMEALVPDDPETYEYHPPAWIWRRTREHQAWGYASLAIYADSWVEAVLSRFRAAVPYPYTGTIGFQYALLGPALELANDLGLDVMFCDLDDSEACYVKGGIAVSRTSCEEGILLIHEYCHYLIAPDEDVLKVDAGTESEGFDSTHEEEDAACALEECVVRQLGFYRYVSQRFVYKPWGKPGEEHTGPAGRRRGLLVLEELGLIKNRVLLSEVVHTTGERRRQRRELLGDAS